MIMQVLQSVLQFSQMVTGLFDGCRWWASLVVCMVATPYLLAQSDQLGSLGWFQTQWDAAAHIALPESVYVQYSIELSIRGDAKELARLESKVKGKPDSPDRRRYERLKRQLESGPRRMNYRLWYSDARHWRLSNDFDDSWPMPYVDTTVGGSTAWQLTSQQLRRMDVESPPADRDPLAALGPILPYYRQWTAMGFGGGSLGLHPESASMQGNVWRGVAVSEDKERRLYYRGHLHDDSILPDTVSASDGELPPGAEGTHYSEWWYSDFLGSWVAGRVTLVTPTTIQAQVLHELRPLKPGEIDALLVEPAIDGRDLIRDKSTFTSIADYRRNAGYVDVVGSDGVTRTPIPPQANSPARFWWLNILGWIAAGLVAAILVWMRVRASRV